MPPCTTLEATANYYSDENTYILGTTKRWGGVCKNTKEKQLMQPSFRYNLVRITRSSLPFFLVCIYFQYFYFSSCPPACGKSQCPLLPPSSALPFISHTSCKRRPCSCLLYTYLPCVFNRIQVRFLLAFVLTLFCPCLSFSQLLYEN